MGLKRERVCANVAKFSTGLGPVSSIEQRSWFTRWIFPFCPGQPEVARAYAPLSGAVARRDTVATPEQAILPAPAGAL